MRIKCPNSDIVLELPGDRTDMKFTCPACHKVHRVTVSITTPGEDPPPPRASSNTRSVTKAGPQMPKKYATGAYAPVVDIPIDANFVLLDESGPAGQPGIDLGAAAAEPPPPRFVDKDLASRQTEIIDDRRESSRMEAKPDAPAEAPAPTEEKPPEPSPRETWKETDEPGPVRADTDETARDRDDEDDDGATGDGAAASPEPAVETPPPPPPPPPALRSAAAPRRRGGARRPVLFLLVVALILGGFLGWQQYGFTKARDRADNFLSWADRAWNEGDVNAAASAAREAAEALAAGRGFHTAHSLYNRAAAATDLVRALPSPTADLERRIEVFAGREGALASFRAALDGADAAGIAALVRETAAEAAGDPALAAALQRFAAAAAVERLKEDGDSLTPEQARARAAADREILGPVLDGKAAETFENELSSFADNQRLRLTNQIKREVIAVAAAARVGDGEALARYRALAGRVRNADVPELAAPVPDLGDGEDRATLEQLERLAAVVDEAEASARTVLSRPDAEDGSSIVDGFVAKAKAVNEPHSTMADAGVELVEATRAIEDDLLGLRVELFGRLQSEMRRNRDYPGTRMAWAMLRSTFDDPAIQVNPRGFRYDTAKARMEFSLGDLPAVMEMDEGDYEKRVRAEMGGYRFSGGWALLFHKPMLWMADLAAAMKQAGVNPARHPDWEVLEGPGGPIALSLPPRAASGVALASPAGDGTRRVFFEGRLRAVEELPAPVDAQRMAEDFRTAARALEEAVMADESIAPSLRQALKPVLMGTYQKPDPRDYFDSAFCRRLIEADYLETYLDPMPDAVRDRLNDYRRALGKVEAGYDEFVVPLDDGAKLYAVARVEADLAEAGTASDQDPETGETLPRYTWRIEREDATEFFAPMPSRFVYAFMLAERYPGRHRVRPAGVPDATEVWHATRGKIASFRDGDAAAQGDAELWNRAIAEDSSGRFDPTIGPPGWNFPLHVLQRDDQGDPVRLATLSGVVESPDFNDIVDAEARRQAEEEWLDHTAEILSDPGELGLIFHQFFRYCSDSPLPELPNLIGSHFGLSDTHQTVYQSLERRWVGRLIGDCDDLAEFFQVLTRRQGKLSHVMQLPGHAAAGYVEPVDGGYRFVVLQTGPVMQFTAPTLNDVVELAYRSFDRGDGISHMTTDAVPLLLRFADEETRTPFVLSARIYEDAEYAETMIKVQSYWHEHVYSAAVEVMEEMVREDPEIGSIKELGSLYERVGSYDKSEEMRRRELGLVRDNPQASLSTLLEITQLHFQEKNREKALESLGEMETIMQRMIRQDDAPEFFRAMTFRSYWAMYLARLGQPERAWNLLRYDATMTKRQLGRIAEPVLRTLVVLYDRMAMLRDAGGGSLSGEARTAMDDVRRELEEAFGRGYFKGDDSYNAIINRYFVLGRYAVSDLGRADGLERLRRDGPYPSGPKDHAPRQRGVDEADWEWFRITPPLYFALGMEMLDQDEYPELYDPAGARPLLEDVARAVEKGRGLGSDVAGGDDVIKADLTLAFLNNDLAAFMRAMATVKEKNYSSLYDDAAMTFGLHCGLIPLADFPAWCEAFRQFFPGSQHYFKVVYRAIDKEHYDHALVMAEATARFFPDHELLKKEAEFIRSIIPDLKVRKYNRAYLRAS